ncbi:hypothetical protein [Maribacter arenosus]|uniref:Uncharacterized protein n=1 Tax=Maribacter arenosus TaxID=1854708 RepID=A0ABR7VC54_9FLAO|nr:hypothetical protein [Maribacter arenosus]MBD0851260.1 hypothetical protein [Maribacter arenosus]
MSGAGHVQDMNNRIKQNRAQRASKRPRFKEHLRDTGYLSSSDHRQPLKFITVSEVTLTAIKNGLGNVQEKTVKKKGWF